MTGNRLGVGLIGAFRWAEKAHLPGYAANPRVDLVALCDIDESRARELAARFGARKVYTDYRRMLADPEIQMIDVCSPTHTHFELSMASLAARRHVLCEKPIAPERAAAFTLAEAAAASGMRTKVGFTFRYSPALRRIRAWIADGTLGEIFHIHGLEQNSQFLDPDFPLRQVPPGADWNTLIPSNIIGYGSHLVDLMRWMGGEFSAVAATMRNFIPDRVVRDHGPQRQRILVEDGTAAVVEFASGAHGILQSSYIAVGNYPGVEIRVYGSKGAAVARLVEEFGVAETLTFATADAVEFKRVELPAADYAPGTSVNTPWAELYYRNLVRHWVDEILDDRPAECTFHDGAKSQEIVDAIIAAHRERRWVSL
jgi:predicted dehydrogenase